MDCPTLTPPNEWVSVENALPPNMDDVLVAVQNNGECWTVTGYYSNTSNVWYAILNGQDTQMDVLWWMPLPAPPGKDNNVPTKAQNEPLTIEQLREMDGEPVYVPETNCWGLITKNQFVPLFTWPDGEQCSAHDWYEQVGPVCRRPPEIQEDTPWTTTS